MTKLTLEQAIDIVTPSVYGSIEDFQLIDAHWGTPATNPNGVVYYVKSNGESVCHKWAICKHTKQVSLFHGSYGAKAYETFLERRKRKGWTPA